MMKETNTLFRTCLAMTLAFGICASATAQGKPATATATPPQAVATALDDLNKASAGNPEMKSLSSDFGSKVSALSKSLGSNPQMQGQLESVVKSLMGDKGAASLAGLQKLTKAKLTPDQTRIAKDVYNTGSAYLVQKNFGSLEGSQTEVSHVVNSLRKGSYAESLPALKKIGQNANLTQPQKDLISSLADQYAPGLKKAGDALKGIPGLNKPEPASATAPAAPAKP
jgi:hypothetical protein